MRVFLTLINLFYNLPFGYVWPPHNHSLVNIDLGGNYFKYPWN